MIQITDQIAIDEKEIQLDFVQSSGPGGQNVNKVATAAQLRFDAIHSPSLPEDVRARLLQIARNRITNDGVLVIEAKQHRTQEQNREDALNRLAALIYQATQKPTPRKKTKPTASSQAERVESKKRRGAVKRLRSTKPENFD